MVAQTASRPTRTPVAIVGLAGMFPQAGNAGEFWNNILAGRDCLAEVPEGHWFGEDFYDPDPFAPDRTYSRHGGFLPPATFDPAEFGMTPRSVDSIGLVQLLSLNVARDVLRDAGATGSAHFDPARAGVILGVCGQNSSMGPLIARIQAPVVEEVAISCGLSRQDAEEVARRYLAAYPQWTTESFPGLLGNVVSGRIAKQFGLAAANYTVDAACASSLAALRGAVDELAMGRADFMITGGCDVDSTIFAYMCFSKTPALSPTGRIRPFDANADGTMLGEGIGMLALKRLADAERDGDRVYAVIRGIGNSTDGPETSIYAPCGQGQRLALERAYADAEVPAASVGLIEAHGTGTPAGDGVELSTLNEFLAGARPRSIAVGSVKAQIGHTKAAAGAAGLIKVALALHDKVLPPHINVDQSREEASAPGSAVYLNPAARPWFRDRGRPVRRGAVSAFGFGGVNFHIVLDEYEGTSGPSPRVARRVPSAHLWHAPDPAALLGLVTGAEPVDPEAPIPAGHARIGFVAADEDEYAERLKTAAAILCEREIAEALERDGVHYRRAAVPDGTRVTALFAGQGSQYPGMGEGAAGAFPPVLAALDAVNLLGPETGSIADAVFPPPGTGREEAEERLRRTDIAQPAIGALSMGQYQYLAELGFAPDACLGHSFGELTALWAAGGLTDDGFLQLAVARGRAMSRATESGDPGTMAAVRCDEERLASILGEHREVTVCNRNAPDELVVGGPTAAVDAFSADCRDQGVTVRTLPVAAAFHTGLVAHAVEEFGRAAAEADFRPPVRQVLAGAPGSVYGDDVRANRETLTAQPTRLVDFHGRVDELHEAGHRVFVEFGPRGILTGLVGRILDGSEVTLVPTDGGPTRDGAAALKEAAVRLAVLGVPLRGLNRYDPLPAQRTEPSPAARELKGPNFAVNDIRATSYRETLAAEHRLQTEATEPALNVERPETRDSAVSGLLRIATDHLELHDRYIDGQLRTSQSLIDLARTAAEHGTAGALTSEIEAVRDHGLALSRVHIKANEVLGELARAHGDPASVALQPNVTGKPEWTIEPAAELTSEQAGPKDAAVERSEPEPVSSDPGDLGDFIRRTIADKTGFPLEMIGDDQDIQVDLGIDSLTLVEIATEIWQHFPEMPRESLYWLSTGRTVGDFATLMAQVLREAGSDSVPPAVRPLPLGRAYVALQDLPEADLRLDAYRPAPVALIADDGGPIATALAAALREAGWQIRVLALPGVEADREAEVCRTLADWGEAALAEAMSALVGEEGALDLGVIALTEVDTPAAAVERLTHALLTAKHLQDPLSKTASRGTRAALVSVTALDGALGYRGSHGRTGGALAGGVGGLLRTFALETEGVFCRALDYAPQLPAEVVAERILREISDASAAAYEVGDDGTTRSAPVLSDTPALLPIPALGGATPAVEPDDLFVVTGGARGITAWCVLEMAREYHCAFLLLGRTPLTGRPGASDAEDEVQSTLESLRALGVQAEYVAADVTDAAAVADALRPHADRVTGVIHGAGVLADEWLKRKTAETVARVVGPKLTGLAAVLDAVDADRLRHLVVLSSVAGLSGNLRQSDYAMANEALNRFACAWRHGHPGCRVSAVPFGPWEGGMANAAIRKLFEQQGVPMLTREHGTRLFTEQLGPDHADHIVTVLGPTKPLYRRTGSLPFGGVRAVRDLTGLAEHPVLRDHAPDGRTPVLPMSAAIGWCGSYLEGLYGDQSMIEVQGFRMVKGVLFDGSERDRFLAEATSAPDIGADWARVSINSRAGAGPAALRCEGRFRMAAEPAAAPVLDGLDGFEVQPFEPHPQYAQGLLFHGPRLIGLGPELLVEPHRVVAMAKLADARLPGFSTRWYDGILADLLPQATQLLERRLSGHRSLPIGVESVEVYAQIPADQLFLIVVDLAERRAFDTRYDVSACDMDGRVLLRWRGLSMLTITPEVAAGFEWIPADRKAAGSA